MKYIDKYKSMGILSKNDAFKYLLANLKDTIRTYDFFVAWEKVFNNVAQIEISLNILNSLLGKKDIVCNLKAIIKQYPEVVPVIPFLIAMRSTKIKVADISGEIEHYFSKKQIYPDEQIEQIIYFAERSGLLNVIASKSIKNLVDYAIGVEVGLDTNARKNRSGAAMESLTETHIKFICDKHGFSYHKQATVGMIKQSFGKTVSTDKADRKYDFALDTGSMIYLIEVNYYGVGGSKLKSVAGEFSTLFHLVKNENTGFIWITDGKGWETASRPLYEAFNVTDYIMNINMIENGLLEEIMTEGL